MKGLITLTLLLAAFGCDTKAQPAKAPETKVAPAKRDGPSENDKAQNQAAEAGELGMGTNEQQAILVRAKLAYLGDQWEVAAKEFKTLTKTGPVSGPQITAYIALAQIYQDQEQKEDALKLYMELLEKAPEVAEVQFVVARAFAESGETTRAIKAYELTIKYQPDYLQAYVELAGLFQKAGRAEEAAKLFLQYEQRVYKLAKVLEDKSADAPSQLKVLEIYSFLQDDRANQAVITALDSPHAAVRERAINLAAEFKLGAATEKVQRMANNDPDLRVRMMSKDAIKALTGAPVEGAQPTFVEKQSELPKPK